MKIFLLLVTISGALAGVLPTQPTREQIRALAVFAEPLMPVGTSSQAEDATLAATVNAWAERTSPDDYSSLENFLSANANSPWALAVRVNLAGTYEKSGRSGKALAAYEQAWNGSKANPDAKPLADTAAAGYLSLLARVGRFAQMQAMLADAGTRAFEGSAGEKISQAKGGLYEMLNHPGESFKCGPAALGAIQRARAVDPENYAEYLLEVQSPQNGFSVYEVWQMSEALGMNLQMAFREPGSAVLTPAVVHWKLDHYGALTKEDNGKYLDAASGLWPTAAAVDDEASGYFLVPAGALPAGWRSVGQSEAEGIRGKGNPPYKDAKALGPNDKKCGDDKCPKGMPRASVHAMLVSLHLEDIPVGYNPPAGPSAEFAVSYSQRDDVQSGTINHSSLGPRWTPHWLSYVTYNPNNASADAILYTRGGGQEIYTGFSPTGNTSAMTWATPTRLWRSGATGTLTFQRLFPDGSKEIFECDDGVPVVEGTVEKRAYLTQIVDAAGNTLTFGYDTSRRILTATDSFGRVTNVLYENSDPYKITKVLDPDGRFARFEYNAEGRLWRITDTLGLQSTFLYSGDFIYSMTTPYGTTGFAFGEANPVRWLETTDPQGDKERVEYRNDWPGKGDNFSATGTDLPTVPAGFLLSNRWIGARNTYYWDKKAFAEAAGNYSKARITHWLHSPSDINTTDRIPESEKLPFSSRVWFNYLGGTNMVHAPGTTALPTKIARVVTAPDGGTETQFLQRSYNTIGNITEEIDPFERKTTYTYDTNAVDLLFVHQQGPGGPEQIFAATYNSQHLPLTITDAAGQTTTYTYNAKGQPLTIKDAKDGVTTFSYNLATGFLNWVDGPRSNDTIFLTPDSFGRIATITDTDNYSLAFEYDAMDRIKKITYPDDTTEKTTYDRLNVSTREDRLKRVTRFWPNSLRQVVAVQDPEGRWTGYDWCRCGDLRSIRDALGRITKWKHDVQGRVTAKVYPDNTTVNYGYDLSSRLATITDPLGQVRALAYNRDDTPARERFLNPINPTPDVTLAWNTYFRRPDSMTDGTGTTGFGYHPTGSLGAGRLASVDGPLAGDTVTHTYDELGLPAQEAIAGIARNFLFDAASRLTHETNPLGQFGYTYDGETRRVATITAPNGLLTALSYLPNLQDRRLETITHTGPGAAAVSSFGYGYDVAGSITSWTQNQPSNTLNPVSAWTIQHDSAGQLTGVNVAGQTAARQAFSYDLAGNRLTAQTGNASTSTSYNALNEIVTITGGGKLRFSGTTSEPANVTVQGQPARMLNATNFTADATVNVGTNSIPIIATDGSGNSRTNNYQVVVPSATARTFSYDPNGNLLNDGQRTYAWDAKYRVIRVTQGADTYEWAYNGLDQRVSEKKNGTLTKRWVWAGGNQPAEERNASGTVTRRFYPQGEQIGDEKFYYTRDHLGSIREVLDATWAIVSSYRFDAWGKRTSLGTEDYATFGFTGHMEHPTLGLVFTQYRLYDPATGRWASRDPLGENGGINLLSYCLNDPVNLLDPWGLWTFGVGGQASGGLGGGTQGSIGVYIGHKSGSGLFGGWGAGLLGNIGGGLYFGAGGSAGGFAQWTNADSVCELKGLSVEAGGSLGELFGIGADVLRGVVTGWTDSGDFKGVGLGYTGFQVNGGFTGGPLPFEAHGFGSYSFGPTIGK